MMNFTKKVFLLVIAIVLSLSCFSQNYKSNKKEAEKIKKSGEYYFATSGVCSNIKSAETKSLTNLVDIIYENCNPRMIFFDDNDASEKTQSMTVFNTFRSEIKGKSKFLVLTNENDDCEVFRYLKKDDFISICNEREYLAKTYFSQGLEVDDQQKEGMSIGDALRYYYWSLIICYSHPYGNDIKITDPVSHKEVVMKDWVYDRINVLLNKINFIPLKKPVLKEHGSVAYEFVVTDGADRIPWLKFEYNNGEINVINTVESGKTTVELVKKNIDIVEIEICIENREDAKAHSKEVYAVMQELDSQVFFKSAIKKINIKKVKTDVETVAYQDSSIVSKIESTEEFVKDNSVTIYIDYLNAMKVIEKAIRNKKIEDARYCFSADGYEMITKLLSNGRYYILGTPELKFMEYGNTVICRSIPMQFNFNNNVGFISNVVFRFDKNSCKVTSIAFRLHEIAEADIMGMEQWEPNSRMAIINFMEDYQTAYSLKDNDYLEKIFSDDALIIVGKVLKQKHKSDNMHLSKEKQVTYDTLSKTEYLGRLKGVFASNEFVNIRFLNTDVAKHKSAEIYGIQVKQEYLSSNYGDIGYLFLVVDLRDKLPVIHVRTWEPDKTEKPIGFNDIVIDILKNN